MHPLCCDFVWQGYAQSTPCCVRRYKTVDRCSPSASRMVRVCGSYNRRLTAHPLLCRRCAGCFP